MFERPHHQRIAHVLAALDGELLRAHACWFGGGTCIAVRWGEYRESVDMDFLVSDADGYRALRLLLTGPQGLNALVRAQAQSLALEEGAGLKARALATRPARPLLAPPTPVPHR